MQEAGAIGEVPMRCSAVHWLLEQVCADGEAGFTDGWHGQPVKLGGKAKYKLIV